MTTYAHDPDARALLATWPTGDGAVAVRVARVPPGLDDGHARRTAGVLTRFSAALWLTYSEHEVGVVPGDELVAAVRCPDRSPAEPPRLADDELVQLARVVGGMLAVAPGRAWRDAVVREVRAEVAAVRDADAGDLAGRARQAVTHLRIDAPARQLAMAREVLDRDPLEPVELLTSVEPHAAAVAAVQRLRSAAVLAAHVVGHRVADVVALAEAIGHEDLEVAREVLVARGDRTGPEVVHDLLEEAVLAGRGIFLLGADPPDPALPPVPGEPGQRVARTVLDPVEPGRHLVDGLVRGIQGCFRVYADGLAGADGDGAGRCDGDRWPERLRVRFVAELRALAAG